MVLPIYLMQIIKLQKMHGCWKRIALDSDGDSIPNYKDSDVFTPKGINVDETGMPRDSDMDGVPDHLDEEKNTSFGALVNFKGANNCQFGS